MHRDCTTWEKEAFNPFTFPSFIRKIHLVKVMYRCDCLQSRLPHIQHCSLCFSKLFWVWKMAKITCMQAKAIIWLWAHLQIGKPKSVLLFLGTRWAHCHIQGEFTESSVCNPTLHCHMLCCRPSLHFPAAEIPLCWTCCPFWRQKEQLPSSPCVHHG